MKNPKVAIVIATYNQDKILRECLRSLKKTKYSNYKIIFVDDTGKNLGEEIKKEFNVELIKTKGSSGQSRVWNLGIESAMKQKFDYILLLDDDTEIIDPNWLSKLIKIGESDKKIGILGCKLLYEDKSFQHIGGYIRKWVITHEKDYRKEPFEVDHIMGCFMLIKKEVIQKIGLVDEIYTPYLLEETDYCIKTKKNGFKIVSVPSVETIHKKSKTINTQTNSRKMFVRFKNDIIFSRRHLSKKNALFRIFIYLPLVAILRKRRDEDELTIKNFILRKEFLMNLFLLVKAFLYVNSKKLK
jgi:GT2 family glycosyltransferase